MKQKEREEQLGLVNRLSKILLSSSDLAEIGRDFVFELKELMSIDWGAIGLIDKHKEVTFLPLSPKLDSSWELGDRISLEGTPIAWVAREKRALLEPDIQRERRFWTGDYWLRKGLRTIAYMPLFSKGEVFGAIIFASRRPQAYRERELKLLKYATTQITPPIQQYRLFQEMEEKVKAAQLHIPEEEKKELTSAITQGIRQEMQKEREELLITELKQNQYSRRELEDGMRAIEEVLNKFSQAIEVYAENLQSHTTTIINLKEITQELKQTLTQQNEVLTELSRVVKEMSTS